VSALTEEYFSGFHDGFRQSGMSVDGQLDSRGKRSHLNRQYSFRY
jgi:hypothetical protein